ncbi:MAG: alpha-galactosidase [Myxococcota bacterium]
MIHFEESTRTWNLVLATSYHALRADRDGRVVCLGCGPRAPGPARPIASGLLPDDPFPRIGVDRQGRRDEVVTFGDHTWHEPTLKVSFPGAAGALPVRDVRLRYASHALERATDGRETLRIRLDDPVQPFSAWLCLRVDAAHDVIERWLELENRGARAVLVEQLGFGTLHLPAGRWDLLHASGGWAAEFQSERVRLPVGTTSLESRSVHTGFVHHPYYLLSPADGATEQSGTVYFGQLAWSGSWRLAFEQRPNGALHVHGGYNPFDFALELAPGERHATPALIHGACADGYSGASQRMHAFLCERVLPHTDPPEPVRPVLYNSWEASYFALSLESQIALARKSAAIGVELFCVDDGWFGGRRNDDAGLGDWTVSPDVFPTGLRPLADEVHRLGMKFGLWVEPEMVNPNSDLYRAHPDWVLHFPDRPRTEQRHQLILDFGRPELLAQLARVLARVVEENDVDFLKWDMNRSATEPGSVVGKAIWRRHAEGVYALMDGLRRRFPRLAIESCSSGGGRVDAGILARTDQFWTSDNTDALARVAIQEGASLAYPARAMCCWVTHERNHQTGRRLELSTRFDVAMRGVLGIGSDLNALDTLELAEYAKWIAFYKRIRNVVQNGVCHRLQVLSTVGSSIVEYVLPDASEAVVSTVALERRIAQLVPPARLRGLDPDALYAAFDRDEREYVRARGVELEALGLDPNLGTGRYGPGYSRTLWLRRVE